jgi:hypothetical protein
MGDYRTMAEQIKSKLEEGFRCIKLKIGAIRFEDELLLLRRIRSRFPAREVTLRVDANGAFKPGEALDKLKRLAEYDVHSIEQPIRAGQWEDMAQLAGQTPVPIALDEELIGCNRPEDKRRLLETIRPQYIVLKPSLHGGISGCREWIDEAGRIGRSWWITSALESNIGLNAIAQWTASILPHPSWKRAQGLGTGGLFTNNISMPLEVRGDRLWWSPSAGLPHGGAGGRFAEWFSPNPCLTVQTSGSTAAPKQLAVRKSRMIESARATCSFLRLEKGDRALLCMDMKYIGAKMMLVRSFVAGLYLLIRQPSGHPLEDVGAPIHFAAMAPIQVYNSLQVPKEKERLRQIRKLLIGGGAIHPALEDELKTFPGEIYSTYGMTETLSHIALRRINGSGASAWYTPFEGVRLTQTDDARLVIEAPWASDSPLCTNDIAELLPDGRFRILGRADNLINSGGVKLQTESLEEKIRPVIPVPFAITSAPHPKFGETVVLLIEKTDCIDTISRQISNLCLPCERPKIIRQVAAIPMTENGKTDRKACKALAL